MAMSLSLLEYLEWEGVDYEVLHHRRTSCSTETAEVAHIPGDQLAKCVVLEDENGYVMAVLPATHRVELGKLHRQLDRRLGLATEGELEELFKDCDIGAIPPVGNAYGYDTVLDDSLKKCSEIYFEAGDHADLVHISGEDFRTLMAGAKHGHFSRHL